ncbi:SRPBCC domain-containing protein [Hyphomonadaceae bacterium ML37]|nr:SRPBCC domain-containing protein [Hyphomonadaceae bacterium ML37]
MSIMLALMLSIAEPAEAPSGPETFTPQGFRHSLSFEINAPRDEVFAAATGDVSPWWDHRFTPDPAELVIEPVFGGRFYERFTDDADDGALHATVIYVNAPETLRLDGPFGLSGRAVTKLVSWRLEEADDGAATVFHVDIALSGEVDPAVAGIVSDVWRHFIGARLTPYVEAGCHLAPQERCAAWD